MKKYQIFISSTYDDLKEERAAVIETVLRLGHIPLGMEAFTATSRKQMELIEKAIDLSDYYILIIGDRYGSIYKDDISFTETEYNYALATNKPVISFIKKRPVALKENEKVKKKFKTFRETVLNNGNNSEFWDNKDELARKVSESLANEFNNNEQIGWVRADSIKDINNKTTYVEWILRNDFVIANAIKEAKRDIFISGSSLVSLYPSVNEDLSNKRMKLLTMDYSDKDMIDQFCKFTGTTYDLLKPEDESFNNFQKVVTAKNAHNNTTISIRKINVMLSTVFVGVDLGENFDEINNSSYIKVQHYLYEKPGSESLNYIVRPDCYLFRFYLEQIKSIWNKSYPYSEF